ncbi:SH3 domain-containing protein [Echinicola vietnamensis DSM 17526]|uniref:SH3 domain-containing protein n=1 Tax=Echinicola vietnamensis (strain DSM 17526 / LMG 23754 / KMM 6221) TaxID=926556 RepID=L0FW43_ECHVK|nr:SH3 domain-containing protein [Echinicola vietnamensis DSM 17526]
MPNINRNFIIKFSIFLTIILQSINCQADNNKLILADSLFNAKSYKEAYNLYTDILQNDEAYSPAMLLKMAYITEGMGNYEDASLYLSKYYDHNPSPKVISKIKSLTDQPDLKGYTVSDSAQFFKILTDYQQPITGTLALLLVVSLIFIFVKKKTHQPKYLIPSAILILLVFMSNNFLVAPQSGIIKESPTIIMGQPTAAGKFIEKVNPGHRVIIKSSEDMWYKIDWEGQDAYVKKNAVSKL